MSVSLKKKDIKKNKVSLRKEELSVVEKTAEAFAGSAEASADDKKYYSRFRLFMPAAIILLFLLMVAGKYVTEKQTDGADINMSDNSMQREEEIIGQKQENEIENTFSDFDKSESISSDLNEADSEKGSLSENDVDDEGVSKNDDAAEEGYIDTAGIHRYEVVTADISWSEAFNDCIKKGGYLCRINSFEENEVIKELLNAQNVRGVVYLGGMREKNSEEYHWIDHEKRPFDDIINGEEYESFWYEGEPSYMDHVDDEEIEENYMSIIYVSAKKDWLWNDVSDDVLSLAPNFFSGRLSYICEFE